MRVDDLMKTYRPGSQDWSWDEEFEEIDNRLLDDPILLSRDGRVLDGHHRIRLAQALGGDTELTTIYHEVEQ